MEICFSNAKRKCFLGSASATPLTILTTSIFIKSFFILTKSEHHVPGPFAGGFPVQLLAFYKHISINYEVSRARSENAFFSSRKGHQIIAFLKTWPK